MARLLLSCDQAVNYCNGKYYARNQERFDFFQRYLRVFDKLRLAVRCVEVNDVAKAGIELIDPRIEIVHIPTFSGPKEYTFSYFKIGKAISRITEGCDAAIIRLPSTIGQRVGHKVMKAGIPYAVEIVYDATDGAANSKSFIERMLWKRIDKDMLAITHKADGVSCVTERILQKHYFSKKPNVFVSNYSSLALDKSFFTSARSYPEKEVLTIAHVANQVDYNTRKGHIQLMQMLKILKERGTIVNIVFVGGDYHNGIFQLKSYAEDLGVRKQVSFTGRVSRDELSSILETSDLFVFPTAAEGLPRVVIEAMAKGLPCVISKVSGNPELVAEDMLVDYLDVKALADKTENLIKTPSKYVAVSEENFQKSQQYEASVLEAKRDDFYFKLKALITNK